MKSLRNSVRLMGHLGQDPEVREIANGKKLAKFSLATNDYYKNSDGDQVTETQWHNIVAWGKTAEIVEKYLHKGSQIAVEGKIEYRTWEDDEGIRHHATDIIVHDLILLDRKNNTNEDNS